MASQRPVIAKINVVAKDYEAILRFYRLVGLEIPDPMEKPAGTLHSEATNTGGSEFALDNEALARIYNSGWRTERDGCSSVVLTAYVSSRDEVDSRYASLISAGYRSRQPPYDAFWGARFAIVCDPEGNDVGLMSPIDEAFRSWPPKNSPDA
jgi:uncharacterized glyoxalase superfamily protein PhnB